MDRIQAHRLFIRVVDLGSFSRAAAELGVGQPAVTKQMARLEAELGARLLHRSTQGVTPTEVGSLYYEKCKLIVHHDEEARSVASLMQSQVQGVLRISTSIAFGRRVLAPWLLAFMKSNPRVRIDLCFDDHYVNLVEQGVDVAIRMGRLADTSLGANYLGLNPWVMVASPGYLGAGGPLAAPQDLKAHDALIYSTAHGDGLWHLRSAAGETESIAVNGRLRSNNLSVLLNAACDGLGVAALPRYVAREGLRTGQVIPLLQDWALPSQDIHAVYPSPRMVPAKVRELVAWLKARMLEEGWCETGASQASAPSVRETGSGSVWTRGPA